MRTSPTSFAPGPRLREPPERLELGPRLAGLVLGRVVRTAQAQDLGPLHAADPGKAVIDSRSHHRAAASVHSDARR